MRVRIVFSAFVLFMLAFTACKNDVASEATTTSEEVETLTPKVDAVTGYIDPACKMKVSEDATITHTHEGVTYGFCGEGCKAAFAQDPNTFLAALEE